MSAGAFAMGNPRAHVRAWAAPSLLLLALTLWSLIGTSAGLGCAAREWDTSPPSKDVCFLAQTYLMGRAELGAPGAQQSSDPGMQAGYGCGGSMAEQVMSERHCRKNAGYRRQKKVQFDRYDDKCAPLTTTFGIVQ